MRPLTEIETQTLFRKLAQYTGPSLTHLISDSAANPTSKNPDRNVFRISGNRVYYVRESLANLATSVARHNLLSIGTCLGKFTKTGKFRLHITALDVIAPHARYKVWVKPNGEMPLLYGGNLVKAHIGRWSEDCPEHQEVVVLSMANDTPLTRGGQSPLQSQYFAKRTLASISVRKILYSQRLDAIEHVPQAVLKFFLDALESGGVGLSEVTASHSTPESRITLFASYLEALSNASQLTTSDNAQGYGQ
ncbi:MAG: hypothetical protein Q9157_002892 [Trypethelium eluteriae]